MSISALYKSWYRKFPGRACEPGCLDCCLGYAPAMSKWEWDQVRHPGKIVTSEISNCPFLTTGGCSIYARRPIICRMFGTVARGDLQGHDIEQILTLACPRGREPANPLPAREALAMLVAYQKLVWGEFAKHLGQWLAYLTPATSGEPIPAKFEWLRYMMATPEGKRKLCMDVFNMNMMPGAAGSWEPVIPRTSQIEAEKLINVLQS